MWDNAPLLKNIANALIAFSVLAVLYGVVHYAVHLPGWFPLQSVQLSAAPQRVEVAEVLRTVRDETNGNFFTVDIDRVRESLEKLPWVRGVSIRREFPNRLMVEMEEHQALARWTNDARFDGLRTGLVNQYGEVFIVGADRAAKSYQELPDFAGPDGASAEVAQHYAQFSGQLALAGLKAVKLALSERHAWQLRLSNGMLLELGREDMQQRLARFVAAQMTEDMSRVKYVDLRYRNGFSVRQGSRG